MSRNTKLTLQLFAALLLIIDASVLTAFGETCTFGGALFGIDYTYRYKIYRAPADSSTSENDNK